MSVNDDITISKGGYSVTLFTTTPTENFKNVLTIIPGVTTPDNQESGAEQATIVDLLRITHTFTFECFITATATKTAKEVKDDLKKMFTGADVNSVPATLTYEDENYDVFLEDCVIKKLNNDNVVDSGYEGKDAAEYSVTLTVVEGELVGGV